MQIHVISVLILALLSSVVFAEELIDNGKSKAYSKTLETVDKKLKRKSYKEQDLPSVIKQISPIKSEATQCVSAEQVENQRLKSDLESLGEVSKAETKEVKLKREDLKKEIARSDKRLATCKVLVLQSDEILKSLADYQQSLLAARLLAVGPDIKTLLQENWNKPALWWHSISSFVTKNSGLELLSGGRVVGLLLINVIALFLGVYIRKRIMARIKNKKTEDTFADHFTCNLLSVVARNLPHLLMSVSTAFFFFEMTSSIKPLPFITVVTYGLPVYFLAKAVVELFLDPGPYARVFDSVPEDIARALARRLKVLLLMLFVGYLLFTTILALSFPDAVYLLSREVFAIIFVLNLIWALWLLAYIPQLEDMVLVRFGVSLFLIGVLVTELIGYRNLSNYIVMGLIGSLFSLGLFILLSLLTSELFVGLEKGKKKWQRHFRESLGVKKRKKLPELLWVKFLMLTALWLIFAVMLLRVWGLPESGFAQIKEVLSEGFALGSLKIIPARVLFAVLALTVMLAISSWFRTKLEASWLARTNMERGAREATATISGYIGVALAIIVSLSVAGVEFGNLAIIAGALSVGIGFGLQNIVNNFVSGLILLFERPIKTGDWIVVGSTEGFVKRISIRSTQIQTFDQADVIVPNSELISGQVTNWMLRDVRGRIRVPVGVAYGSDTKLVHKLLLEVASNNATVVHDGSSPEPKVLFMGFGDSSLDFELRVFIRSIDEKPNATSELNFAIDEAFRKHNIEIPFPQRDIHIRSSFSGKDLSE